MNRRLAQLFKRSSVDSTSIENMPPDYIEGWYEGAYAGRESQRNADLMVAERLLAPPQSNKG